MNLSLHVRQQPEVGRMSGFLTDIRTLGPSLIVQLIVERNGQTFRSIPENETNGLVLAVHLEKLRNGIRVTTNEAGADKNERLRLTNNLVGNCVSNCHHFRDVDQKPAMFFIFPDLAVRSPGTYQFRLSLYHIGKPQSSVVAHELSRTFEIVSPKNYPGPSEPTHLAVCLVQQGVDPRTR